MLLEGHELEERSRLTHIIRERWCTTKFQGNSAFQFVHPVPNVKCSMLKKLLCVLYIAISELLWFTYLAKL